MSPFEIRYPADIGPDRTLLFWMDRRLTFSARPRLRFALYWLRETGLGEFATELCKRFDSEVRVPLRATLDATFLVAVALDQEGRLRLRVSKWRTSSLKVEAVPGAKAAHERILEALSSLDSYAPSRAAARLAKAIWEQAPGAIAKKCAAGFCRRTLRSVALFESSFDFTPEGLAAYRSALEERGLAGSVSRFLSRDETIEVHLPAVDRKESPARWKAMGDAEAVAEEDGRIFVYTAAGRPAQQNARQNGLALAAPLLYPRCPGFEIGFTDVRTATAAELAQSLPRALAPYGFGAEPLQWLESAPEGEVTASVALSIPGSLAGAWLRAPGEKDPNFFPVYSKVTVAAQQAFRRWLPYVYFSDLSRFENLPVAYSLLFYRGTYPCFGRPRCDFAHDLVSREDPGVARPWAWRRLAASMARAQKLLIAAGQTDLAYYYASWRAPEILPEIVLRPKLINELLSNDSFFIDRLVNLGLAARDLASGFAVNRSRATKDLAVLIDDLTAAANRRLKRLYDGRDFTSLGALLLVEATRALAAALGDPAAISATLRFRAQGREQTFVNGAR